MMVCDVKDAELRSIVASCGLKCSAHALERIKQRLAPVHVDVFRSNLDLASRIYRSEKARKKRKLRITKKGVLMRNEYYVRVNGVTYIFSGDSLVSVYV
jgi:hypothetical protein